MPDLKAFPHRAAGLAAAAVLVLGACSTHDPSTVEPSGTSSTATSATTVVVTESSTPTTTTQAPAGSYDELAARLVDEVAGHYQLPDATLGSGPISLAMASGTDANGPTVRQALIAEGYVRGYERHWRSPGTDPPVDLWVYQFGSPAGAEQDWARTVARLPSVLAQQGASLGLDPSETTAVPFTVPGFPAEHTAAFLTRRGAVVYVTFASGPYRVEVVSAGLKERVQMFATTVARDQLARL